MKNYINKYECSRKIKSMNSRKHKNIKKRPVFLCPLWSKWHEKEHDEKTYSHVPSANVIVAHTASGMHINSYDTTVRPACTVFYACLLHAIRYISLYGERQPASPFRPHIHVPRYMYMRFTVSVCVWLRYIDFIYDFLSFCVVVRLLTVFSRGSLNHSQ